MTQRLMSILKKNQKQLRRQQRGMTLIEIMIVIAILGVMMGAAAFALIPKLHEAKVDTVRQDIHTIEGALKMYVARKGKYPATSDGIKALVDTQQLDRMPLDPWGNEYVYINSAGKPVILSYGADGQQGGDGNGQDISSSDSVTK